MIFPKVSFIILLSPFWGKKGSSIKLFYKWNTIKSNQLFFLLEYIILVTIMGFGDTMKERTMTF